MMCSRELLHYSGSCWAARTLDNNVKWKQHFVCFWRRGYHNETNGKQRLPGRSCSIGKTKWVGMLRISLLQGCFVLNFIISLAFVATERDILFGVGRLECREQWPWNFSSVMALATKKIWKPKLKKMYKIASIIKAFVFFFFLTDAFYKLPKGIFDVWHCQKISNLLYYAFIMPLNTIILIPPCGVCLNECERKTREGGENE